MPESALTMSRFGPPGVSAMMSSPALYLVTRSLPRSVPANALLLYSIAPLGEKCGPKSYAKPRQFRSGPVPVAYSGTSAGSVELVGLPPLRVHSQRVGSGRRHQSGRHVPLHGARGQPDLEVGAAP